LSGRLGDKKTLAFPLNLFYYLIQQLIQFISKRGGSSMKNLLIAAAVLFVLFSFFTVSANAGESKKVKVVYHFNSDDPKIHKAGLINIQNHIDAVEKENVEIIAVLHGPGLTMLQKGKTEDDNFLRIANLKKQGVKFGVCNVTITRQKLNKDELFVGIVGKDKIKDSEIVPSGVAELAKLQSQGYAYIKP
jgi:intracellular sulfur oxidation DsrE/DsrF family protein